MTDEDRVFVENARKRWRALIDGSGRMSAPAGALAVALWATGNVDRLLDIAERKAKQ